jgi:uncharacterized protein YjbJ (UPF0337 family)
MHKISKSRYLMARLRFNKFRSLSKMSTEQRIDATIKNVEGKVQEAMGEITGNPQDKAEGKQKQAEAQVQHSVENVKDEIKRTIDNP